MGLVWLAFGLLGLALAGLLARRVLERRPKLGEAIVISRRGRHRPQVVFDRAVVRPMLDHAEIIDLTTRAVVIDRLARGGLTTKDGLRVDVKVELAVQVGRTTDDIVEVAEKVGCERATDPSVLVELFGDRFGGSVRTAVEQFTYDDARTDLPALEEAISETITDDLGGYVLVDVRVERYELTSPEHLDRDNLVDARALNRLKQRGES